MSGPKYSTAEIEAIRLQALLQQLEAEIENERRKILVAELKEKSHAFANLKKAYSILNIDGVLNSTADLLKDSSIAELLTAQKITADKICSFSPSKSENSQKLTDTINELDRRTEVLSRLMGQIKASMDDLNIEYSRKRTDNMESAFKEKTRESKNITKERSSLRLQQLYSELLELMIGDSGSDSALKSAQELITNRNVDEGYKVQMLSERVNAAKVEQGYQKGKKERNGLKMECQALYSLLGKVERRIPETINELTELKGKLEKEARQRKSSEYIAQCMEEVMSNVGYNILSSDVLTTPKDKVERNIYDVSDESVLNVSASETGAIMFEVLARKKGDAVSANQCAAVKQDMERFCPDYSLIKRKLAEKGIILKGEVLYEAAEKYVRAIDVKSTGDSNRRANNNRKKEGRLIDG